MIIAYNDKWLKNWVILKYARIWLKNGIITKPQFESILKEYECGFYSPSLILGILLFIASFIGILGGFGLLSFFFTDHVNTIKFLALIFGVTSLFFLDLLLIQKHHHYKSGVTEAFLYQALGCILIALISLIDMHFPNAWLLIFVFLVLTSIRYLDLLLCAGAILSLTLFIFYTLFDAGETINPFIPVIFLVFFIPIYFIARKYKNHKEIWPWKNHLLIIECASLIFIYLSGNYYVIRELRVSLMNLVLLPGEDIPMAWIFYGLTVIIPAIYLYFGIKNKEMVLIRLGLITLAFSAFTFKYYFSLGMPEVVLTFSGILLILVAILFLNYLRTMRHGFTRKNLISEKWADMNAEAFIISQTMGGNNAGNTQDNIEFGGGEFGGGGASSKF